MGLFNRNDKNGINEELYTSNDGYKYGRDSGIIYHVPEYTYNHIYTFPEGTTGLSETAIMELRKYQVKCIIVPASFKKFNVQFLNFENLEMIDLKEGIEEVKCRFDNNKVDILLPSTIKKIGQGNYPITENLVLPNGVEEFENLFASHDTNLISVTIPGTIKQISKGAFNQCKNLQTVILDEGVETAMLDSFRGTNRLHSLVLPSTFNGTIALSMDPRGITNGRGNSKYDSKRFEEDQNAILRVQITRGNKVFTINMKRKEQPTIAIQRNIIKIKCASQIQVITINSNQFQSGIYNIEDGLLKPVDQLSVPEERENNNVVSQEKNISQDDLRAQEEENNLDIIFQEAYRENITKRDDFVGLSSTTKMQIKKAMKNLFFQMAKQFGTINTSFEMFDYLYNRVLKETEFEEELEGSQLPTNFGSTGKRK